MRYWHSFDEMKIILFLSDITTTHHDVLSQHVAFLKLELSHTTKVSERRLRAVEVTTKGMEAVVRRKQEETEARCREVSR